MNLTWQENFALRAHDLSVVLDGFTILDGLSFSVLKGSATAIIGPNGAGKTSLFRALLGLIPYRGTVEWAEDVRIGYVPQKFSVDKNLPLTVREFFALKLKNDNKEHIFSALRDVGITGDEYHIERHILDRRMGVLSGGEIQKIGIAWALLGETNVLLFDEPTAGIDVGGEETIYELIKRLCKERGLTVLLISHELNVVYQYVDQVICLNKTMICQGTPNDVLDNEVLRKLYGAHVGVYQHHANN